MGGIGEIIESHPDLYDSFKTLFSGHLASSTHSSYDWILREFKIFCEANDYPYPHFNKKSTLQFLAYGVSRNKTYSWFKKYRLSLVSLETSLARETSEIPAAVATGCASMMRRLAATKPAPRKATPFGQEELKILIDSIIWKKYEEGQRPDIVEFRALLRVVTYFHTWLR